MSKSYRPISIYGMFLSAFLHASIRTITCQSPASSPAFSPPAPLLSSPAASPPAPPTSSPAASPPAPPASSPVASPPAPAGPANITAILEKAGGFKTLIKLLQSTHVGDHIYTQLNDSKQGMTVFAPSDNAFTALKAGTLNSLNDQQQVTLMLFHVLSSFIPLTQFQTVSNPIRTQAGDTGNFQFPLNVITMGKQVNISTGVINATVIGPIYSDNQLAVYQVDKVLLPLKLFGPKPPAPAPSPTEAPSEAKKKNKNLSAPAAEISSEDTSGDMGFNTKEALSLMAAIIAGFLL